MLGHYRIYKITVNERDFVDYGLCTTLRVGLKLKHYRT